jgi:hypothetical protein
VQAEVEKTIGGWGVGSDFRGNVLPSPSLPLSPSGVRGEEEEKFEEGVAARAVRRTPYWGEFPRAYPGGRTRLPPTPEL